MIGFEESSLSNDTMSQIVRGYKTKYGEQLNGVSFYLPPTLKLYTLFSLQEYFIMFCGLLVLQITIIFALDHWWLKCLPKNLTIVERLLHAHLKSHFPFPYTDWDCEKGDCNAQFLRHKTAQQEVAITTLVNFSFAILMTFPMVILCKLVYPK